MCCYYRSSFRSVTATQFTSVVVLCFFVIKSSTEQRQSGLSRPPHISLQQWSDLSFSEAPAELGLSLGGDARPSTVDVAEGNNESGRAEEIWNRAIQFQWNQCHAYERSGSTSPWPFGGASCSFLICHLGGTGSGYARKKSLQRSLFEAQLNETSSADGEVKERNASDNGEDHFVLKTAYNKEKGWCGFVRLNATVAERMQCSGEGDAICSLTPMFFGMKIVSGAVDRIQQQIEDYYDMVLEESTDNEKEKGVDEDLGKELRNKGKVRFPMLRIELCPGVISQENIDKLSSTTPGEENGNSSSVDWMTIDVTQKIADWLLMRRNMVGERNATAAPTLSVSEAMFWASSTIEDGEYSTRQAFWKEVLQLTLETGECNVTYSERLIWMAEFRNATDFSSLQVTFNGTAAVDLDKRCALALLAGIAVLPGVCAVEVPQQPFLNNVNAQWMIQSGGLKEERPWFDHGLDGSGQVVAIADSGIDSNNCYFWDSENDVDFRLTSDHRKIVQYVPYADGRDVMHGHGTQVAGTIAGRRSSDGLVESRGAADGIAKGAKIAFFDIGDENGELWVGPSFLMLETGRTGDGKDPPHAHLHSVSWGTRGDNHYTFQARNFDSYMRNNDDFLAIASAGNGGSSASTVWSPATFKNGIAVGASHSCCDDLANGQLGPAYVAPFSSRGPTEDGRMAPHVVAPGRYILTAAALPDETGECDDADGDGEDDVPAVGGARGGLISSQGTSLAAPVVAATAAQIRQYFSEGYYPGGRAGSGRTMSPSGALVKAVLLNGAQTNIKGVDDGGADVSPVYPYDNTIGFGRIDLQKSLYLEGWSDVQAQIWDRVTIDDGETKTYAVSMDMSNGCTYDKLSATLVWMDSEVIIGCNHCLVDDLDLQITRDDSTEDAAVIYYPNGRNNRDDINNAERVVVLDVRHGDNFTLTVTAFNLDGASQQFALVATGCFGGVANNLSTSQNIFDADNSAEQLRKDNNLRIVIIACSIVAGVIFMGLLCFFLCRKRRRKGDADNYATK